MIGFVLTYVRSDEAFATLQWARWLEAKGHDVDLFPLTLEPPVCPGWDHRAARNKSAKYSEWLKKLSHVVFSYPPQPELVSLAKDAGVTTIYVALWDYITPQDVTAIAKFDVVLCPAKAIHRCVLDMKLPAASRRVFRVPWELLMPLVLSDQEVDSDRIGIVWNLDGDQAARVDMSVFDMIGRLIKIKYLYFTFFIGSNLTPEASARLDDFRYRADGRLEVIKNPSLEKQIITTSIHDLTIWPSTKESLGLPGLISITAGTPCIAYDHPVVSDVVKDGKSGTLVPCELCDDDLGVPAVIPDNDRFYEETVKLINDPDTLQGTRATVQSNSAVRQEIFETLSSKIFSD